MPRHRSAAASAPFARIVGVSAAGAMGDIPPSRGFFRCQPQCCSPSLARGESGFWRIAVAVAARFGNGMSFQHNVAEKRPGNESFEIRDQINDNNTVPRPHYDPLQDFGRSRRLTYNTRRHVHAKCTSLHLADDITSHEKGWNCGNARTSGGSTHTSNPAVSNSGLSRAVLYDTVHGNMADIPIRNHGPCLLPSR